MSFHINNQITMVQKLLMLSYSINATVSQQSDLIGSDQILNNIVECHNSSSHRKRHRPGFAEKKDSGSNCWEEGETGVSIPFTMIYYYGKYEGNIAILMVLMTMMMMMNDNDDDDDDDDDNDDDPTG